MSDEEEADWFERALSEVEAESESSGDSDDSTTGEPDEETSAAAFDAESTDDESDSSAEGEETDESSSFDDDAWTSLGDHPGRQSDDAAWDELSPDSDSAPDGESPTTDRSALDEALSNAFEGPAPDTASGGPDAAGDDFGFADFEDPGTGDDFGFAGDMGGGGDFGFGGGGGSDFDEETYESDIDRIEIGIEGLDEMILGGVPERSMIAAVGGAGTGKTTFGLQFLHTALSKDRRAVYITLEESRESILDTADEKGWNFSEHADEGRLVVVDLHPIEMANSLANIRDDLPRLIEEFGAERLVLDSVSLLEMMYDAPSERRSEVFEFARALKDAGVTTFVTSEASSENSYASRYGIIEYLADAVFVLQYVRPSDFRETRLAVEIQKIRDANHSRETKPYEITNQGISVYRQANIF